MLQGKIEGDDGIFRNLGGSASAAMAQKQRRGWHGDNFTSPAPRIIVKSIRGQAVLKLVEVEVADGFAGIWRFLRLLYGFLEFLFQKLGGILLVFHRLPKN